MAIGCHGRAYGSRSVCVAAASSTFPNSHHTVGCVDAWGRCSHWHASLSGVQPEPRQCQYTGMSLCCTLAAPHLSVSAPAADTPRSSQASEVAAAPSECSSENKKSFKWENRLLGTSRLSCPSHCPKRLLLSTFLPQHFRKNPS